ncbi:MAG: GNAT family N-acetyltransferase [Thermoplasmata archaeon]|nr:GNAT family N-acetyltransferase [Thermoplasmata archaeon]
MIQASADAGTGGVTIRELRRSDGVSFSEVMLGSYGPFEAMLGLGTRGISEFAPLFRRRTWFLLKFFKTIGLLPLRFFVAAEGGIVVGTTMVIQWPKSGYILGVGVRPSHRRRGLAGQMLSRAEQLTAQRSRSWALLDVEEENHPAVTLYRARRYEQIQSTVWYRCSDPTTMGAALRPSSSVRVIGKSGRKAAAAWCARRVPGSVTAVLPPDAARLTHLESLGQFPGTARETWSVGPVDAPVGFVSACSRGNGLPGMLFLPAVDPGASRDDLGRLVQEASAWLTARGCTVVLAAVPEPARPAIPVLEELGFSAQLSTLTMARPLTVA